MVDDIGRDEIRVFAHDAGAAQAHHSLRHVQLGDDTPAAVAHRRIGYRRPRRTRGQCAEHAVEHLAQRRRVDIADRRDFEPIAGHHLAQIGPQVVNGNRRNRGQRAVGRTAIRVVRKRSMPPRAACDRARIGGFSAQRRQNLVANAAHGVGVEARLIEREPQQIEALILTLLEQADRSVEIIMGRAEAQLDGIFLEFHDIEVDLAGRKALTRTGRAVELRYCVSTHLLVLALA